MEPRAETVHVLASTVPRRGGWVPPDSGGDVSMTTGDRFQLLGDQGGPGPGTVQGEEVGVLELSSI